MDKKELLELVNFFNRLEVEEEDNTTEEQRANGQLEVIATYKFEGKTYRTKPLYYKNANLQENAAHLDYLSFFEEDAFWLDIGKNQWPEGRGGNIEAKAIPDMTDDEDFKKFLLTLVNNNKTGFIQKITKDGRSQQYGLNLENNNHWHDLVKLIKDGIKNKGCNIDKKYFSRLVFKCNDGNRVSLHPSYGDRKIIQDFYKNIKSIQGNMEHQNIINLLEYKKQIILQGPPGTGKTFTAKDIAYQIIFNRPIDDTNRKKELELLKNSEQFELIQFHPAYTYEDFVRGIVVQTNEGNLEYVKENKILGKFAKQALGNQIESKKEDGEVNEEMEIDQLFQLFTEEIEMKLEDLQPNEKVQINKTAYFTKVQTEDKRFRYTGDNWNIKYDGIMKFNDIKNIYKGVYIDKKELKTLENVSKTAKQDKAYFGKVAEQFKEFVDRTSKPIIKIVEKVPLKKYVLIIDEINRANLPSVLGELIYGLEYRDTKVKSMYEVEDDIYLTLPNNLYIIGTMNTADRSVGHIDYAIRRRFAFVDILPSSNVIDSVMSDNVLKEKAKNLFKEVASLFTSDYLASDFEAKDVQLGHSYFLTSSEDELKIKLKFEIKPILNEYVKDGILNNQAKEKIEDLNV